MKISVISHTRAGAKKNLELTAILQKSNHQAASYSWHKYTGRKLIPFQSLKLLFQDLWDSQEVFILLWEMEQVARTVLPWLKKKGQGPAVAVMDEQGKFVIPLLRGQLAGADAWFDRFAQTVGATAVITAPPAEEEGFDVAAFAQKNRMHIQDIFRIRNVAAALLAKEPVGVYSDYPVEGVWPEGLVCCKSVMCRDDAEEKERPKVGISITDDWEAPHFARECRMFPRNLVLGIVCPAKTDKEALEQFVSGALAQHHISRERVGSLYSVREQEGTSAIVALAKHLGIPFFTYEKEQLCRMRETPCEACAYLGSRKGKRLALCQGEDGLQVSIYEKEWEVSF